MDPDTIPRPNPFQGLEGLINRIKKIEDRQREISAQISQMTVVSGESVTRDWQPGTDWADAATLTFTRPAWALAAVVNASGYVYPKFNVAAPSSYCYAQLVVSGKYVSPQFLSFMASVDFPNGLSHPFHITDLEDTLTVTTQAYATSGATVAGGSASVSAVVQWVR